MRIRRACLYCSVVVASLLACAWDARAQGDSVESRLAVEVAVGFDNSINGNVNSGAIGVINGLATAFLPQSYSRVYGTGIQVRFAVGYLLDERNEVRASYTFQSADADLVRLGDLGPSSLYAQYDSYRAHSLDFGYRRYLPISSKNVRVFGEGTIGVGFIESIDAQLAAPQSNVIFTPSSFYDSTAAFAWSLGAGVLFPIANRLDLSAQLGFRHVGSLARSNIFAGTGLEKVTDDSARLTFPIIVGVRYKFK